MLIIDWREFLEKGLPIEKNLSSMTVGIFDGVHRGHQALLKRVVSYNANYVPVVVTFKENHKTNTVKNSSKEFHTEAQRHGEESGIVDILTFERKTEILASLGVEILLVINFTDSFKHIKGIEFLETLLKHGNIGFFAVGKNFRCGYKLDTDAQEIKDFFCFTKYPHRNSKRSYGRLITNQLKPYPFMHRSWRSTDSRDNVGEQIRYSLKISC